MPCVHGPCRAVRLNVLDFGESLGDNKKVMARLVSASLWLVVACLISPPIFAQTPFRAIEAGCDHAAHAINVRVHGVRNDHGFVTFALYGDNPDHFLKKGKKIFQHRFSAKPGTMAFCILVPEAGTYAAAAYHDENGNTKFDKNWIGFPAEAFGVSNNPRTFLLPPSHEEAAFRVDDQGVTVEIKLNY